MPLVSMYTTSWGHILMCNSTVSKIFDGLSIGAPAAIVPPWQVCLTKWLPCWKASCCTLKRVILKAEGAMVCRFSWSFFCGRSSLSSSSSKPDTTTAVGSTWDYSWVNSSFLSSSQPLVSFRLCFLKLSRRHEDWNCTKHSIPTLCSTSIIWHDLSQIVLSCLILVIVKLGCSAYDMRFSQYGNALAPFERFESNDETQAQVRSLDLKILNTQQHLTKLQSRSSRITSLAMSNKAKRFVCSDCIQARCKMKETWPYNLDIQLFK